MNKVAVILLNWNGLQDTIECIESIKSSNGAEVICYVVDNASLNNEAADIQSKFPEVRVLAQRENHGFCKGNNIGIQQALDDGFEYVLILNNDTLVPIGAIEKLLNEYEKLPDAGAISSVILEYPSIEKVWFAKAEWDSSRAQFSLDPEGKTFSELTLLPVWSTEFSCGCCLLTSAKVLRVVGLLDERYFAYYDEAEWCKRIEKHGYKSYTTSKSYIYHKVSRTTPGIISTYLLARNRLLWMKENLSRSKRKESTAYLLKEKLWHKLNIWGLVSGQYSKKHSKAFLQGCKDYRRGNFGRWSDKTEKIIFFSK